MNLIEKLIEVRKAVPYLQKENSGYQFKYVSSSQTLGALRGAMDKQGVLLVPSVTTAEVADHTTSKGGHEYFTKLGMSFTWIDAKNPEDQITCQWYGQGLDSGEKGVGKAMTYAEKFFLLKFFNIATDKDDPDAFQAKDPMDSPERKATREAGGRDFPNEGRGAPEKPSRDSSGGKKDFSDYDPTGDTRPVTEKQLKRLFAKSKTIKATDEEMKRFIKAAADVDSSKDLNREQIDRIFKLMETFEEAREHAHDMFSEWLSFNPVGE
jgi:hypothetical protein